MAIVDARNYKEVMSAQYDVTIFDEAQYLIKEQVIHKDSVTRKFLSIEPAKYVSDDFNYVSLFIGHTLSVIDSRLDSKLYGYCLCLNRLANHIKAEHDIFKDPFKIAIVF